MEEPSTGQGLRLGLVGGGAALEDAIRDACVSSHVLVPCDVSAGRGALCKDGAEALDALLVAWPAQVAAREAFDELVRAPRRMVVPLVALCGDGENERVEGLSAGADLIASLPLHVPLLEARLMARRRLLGGRQNGRLPADGRLPGAAHDKDTLRIGPIRLNEKDQVVTIKGKRVELTPKELELLSFLIRHAGACCTRGRILDNVWGIDFETGTNMVDVYIHFLRQKLKAHDLPGVIRTVRGKGYRLILPRRADSE